MKKRVMSVLSGIIFLAMCGCGAMTDFYNASGETLIAEPVDIDPTDIDDDDIPDEDEIVYNDLFSQAPGTKVPLKNLSAAVDPVGTKVTDDYDGDGIVNSKETTSNVWVGDYPDVEASVLTPITMKIEVLLSDSVTTKSISSEIKSSDMVNSSDESSEKIHRNEVNNKTVQFQDSFSNSTSNSISSSTSSSTSKTIVAATGSRLFLGADGKKSKIKDGYTNSYSSSTSDSNSDSNSATTTKWKDVPFKDNLDRNSSSIASKSASKNSRSVRAEMSREHLTTANIKPNAGYIRASMNIENTTVNMPVKVSNVRCAFMFETPEGALLPVQNYLLRNDDYSVFSVNLYGGTTFGPYVIELSGLNTAEVKDAIAKGYNPKIIVLDYDMTHVEDSNYRQALSSSFTGNNLKIIEENVKGRTAGVKLIGPGLREFYRVAAFDTDGVESRTGSSGITAMSPGVSLMKALARISYSGTEIEFANYVIDFSGVAPEMVIPKPNNAGNYPPKIFVRGIKRINDCENKVAYSQVINESNGTKTYILKPISEWTDTELAEMKMWTVMSVGKYFNNSREGELGKAFSFSDYAGKLYNVSPQGEYSYSENGVSVTVPAIEGIGSTVWPGDHYDVVCIQTPEIIESTTSFGTNPIETGEAIPLNTRWNAADFPNKSYFEPESKSVFLGEALPGEQIVIKVKLNQSQYLNPSFGTASSNAYGAEVYRSFGYNSTVTTQRFSVDQGSDFEIALGNGGTYNHWVNLNDIGLATPQRRLSSDTLGFSLVEPPSWDYANQMYTFKIQIPENIDGVGNDETAKLYIRPALNNAYRESLWPLKGSDIMKFRGVLSSALNKNGKSASFRFKSGTLAAGDTLVLKGVNTESLVVSTIDTEDGSVTFATPIVYEHQKGEQAYVVPAAPMSQELCYWVEGGSSFFTGWNTQYGGIPDPMVSSNLMLMTGESAGPQSPAKYLGYNTSYIAANWIGANNYGDPLWNGWMDASKFNSLNSLTLNPYMTTTAGYNSYITDPVDFGTGSSVVNGASNTRQYAWSTAISGDYMFMVWQSEESVNSAGLYDIYGRVYKLSTNSWIGDQFRINTITTNDQCDPTIVIKGDKAFVAWRSKNNGTSYNIYGRRFAYSTGVAVDSADYLISSSTTAEDMNGLSIVANSSADYVYVLWVSTKISNSDSDVVGTLLNVNLKTVKKAPYDLHDASTLDQNGYTAVCREGRMLILIQSKGSDGWYDTYARIYDMSDGSRVLIDGSTDAYPIATSSSAKHCYNSRISTSVDTAFITWQETTDSNTNMNIRGLLFDISQGTIKKSAQDIPTNSAYLNSGFSAVATDKYWLTVWEISDVGSDRGIRGRLFTKSGTPVGEQFVIQTNGSNDQRSPRITLVNGRALITWTSQDDSLYLKKMCRIFDVNGNKFIGNDIELGRMDYQTSFTNYGSTKSSWNYAGTSVYSAGGNLYTVWSETKTGTDFDINMRIINKFYDNFSGSSLVNGSSNFMVAPLIERDYTVTSSYLE